jgi:D-alanyl-D-alanine dipeptidase
MNLSKRVKISTAAGVAASTDLEGSVLDMQGFEGVLMVVRFGAITGSAVTSIKAQQGAAVAMGDAADLLGTSQTIADDDDDQIFYIDVYRPTERYVRLYVDRATQNAVIASAEYIQYGAKSLPTTHGTGVSGETHISPAEGTA